MCLGMKVVLPTGEVGAHRRSGGGCARIRFDGIFVGSEGTLALVTEITVKLTPLPEAVKTLLAIFDSVDDATETVVDITARGITPAACEMLDGWTLRAVEAYVHAGFPLDSAAVLLLEVDGLREVGGDAGEGRGGSLRGASRARGARGARCGRARFAVEGAQECVWRGGAAFADLLRAGRRDSADEIAGDFAAD